MTITKQFSTITSYQNDNFKDWFGDMEFVAKKSKLYGKVLGKPMTDEEIQSKLKPTELTISEVFNFLETDARKEDWMIFYCQDKDKVLRAVSVGWDGDGWGVLAVALDDDGWHGGRQVFSRSEFLSDTLTPKPLESSLENRVKALEDFKTKVEEVLKL